MRRILPLVAFWLLVPTAVLATYSSGNLSPVRNARLVYVTAYSGPEFSANLLQEDRRAIGNVQEALQKQGYTVVYHPREAEMIVAVESRPSEDVLAVYDRQSFRTGTYLWRAMGKGGLARPNMPLVQQFEKAMGKTGGKQAG